MKDILQDIVGHTHSLGFLDIVKITGTDEKTQIDAIAENRTVIMFGETTNPYPEMLGVFGMSQLNKLKYLLDCPEYKEDAKIETIIANKNSTDIPVGIHFENKGGDFQNDYRFMNTEIINEKIKSLKFKGVKWDVELAPSISSIQRFAFQAAANSEHNTFIAKTDGDKLVFTFGDATSHAGEFVFSSGISGKLSRAWSWPVAPVLAILKAADANNTQLSLSNDGALQVMLDSGLATYKYIIPAIT
ncbi:MAG: hypothetical protein EBU90_16215 [Proteobacteria bacterium]|nr:hypothetical protein [Pseudomonadota bacterium]